MNKNEFMNKVTEMVMGDPSMRESLKKLTMSCPRSNLPLNRSLR